LLQRTKVKETPSTKTEAKAKWSNPKSTTAASTACWDWSTPTKTINHPIKPQWISAVYRIILDIGVEI
jgi:hypothetical protein